MRMKSGCKGRPARRNLVFVYGLRRGKGQQSSLSRRSWPAILVLYRFGGLALGCNMHSRPHGWSDDGPLKMVDG